MYRESIEEALKKISQNYIGTVNEILDEMMKLEQIKDTLMVEYIQILFDLNTEKFKFEMYKSSRINDEDIKSLKNQEQRISKIISEYERYNVLKDLELLEEVYSKVLKHIMAKQKVYEVYVENFPKK